MPQTRTAARPTTTAAPRPPRVTRSRTRVATSPAWPANAPAPVLIEQRRGPVTESRHRGHVVQVGSDGSIERAIGDPNVIVTLRSAVKPFALLALVESDAVDELHLTDSELAVMAASHHGEDLHVRTLQAVFRRAALSQNLLACGSERAPIDELTRVRLARDGETPGPIRHMCSGFHAASILLSRQAGWSLEDYWHADHPSQAAVRSAVARCFGTVPDALLTAGDDCGVLTYAFPLVEVARAYALLADPLGAAPDPRRSVLAPSLTRIRDAMLAAPELVGGVRDSLTTSVMKAGAGGLIAKSGAESLQGIGFVPGAGQVVAGGMAAKIDDGDGRDRALGPVVVEALVQVGALDERAVRALAAFARPSMRDAHGDVVAHAVPVFELAPISELG
ncbi:MAG TPA: asparaginase [Candidatus Limnocylindrales bacterium]|nr:asparaginase [Candidatus Limnocylindrales bacterium]